MTKINSIKIHGFKSFAHKTEIPFDKKFNCILGPNGSGKSNVGDALCFVLGRISAKSMRAEKAVNLIFNGGKKKQPSKNAMVEIAFDNSQKIFPVDDHEVILNRTITGKGASVYRINGKKRTRTEVLDMLSLAKINPEGYNIILQGDITRFVDMSPLERRRVIEEISDVSVYEEKKHKATLELNKVEDKLNNAQIILKERGTHLKELKKDRDQALKFKEAKDTIDSRKATLVDMQIKDKSTIKGKYDKEINEKQEHIDKAEAKIKSFKGTIGEKKQKVDVINKEIEQKGEKEQLKVHRDLEDLKVELAEEKARISTLKDEINKVQQRKDQMQQELGELDEKTSSYSKKQQDITEGIRRKKRELETIENNIAQFKKKHKIESSQEMEQDLEEKDKLIDQKQDDVQKLRQQQQELLREKDKLEYQLETMKEKMKKVKEVKKEHKDQIKKLEKFKSDFKAATLRLNQLLDQDSSFASQIGNAKKNLMSLQERLAQLQVKNASFQAGITPNEAIKTIMSQKKKGIYGTVASLGQVNKKYSEPLERAAGGKMQQIVVDDDKIAAECIQMLKKMKIGAASFIPLNKIKYRDISAEDKKHLKQDGVHNFALNLISYKPQFKKAFAHVFGNTLVVEDVDTARKVGVGRIKMAGLDGSISEASGVMRGGHFNKKGLSFREKDSMEELSKVEKEVNDLQNVISANQTKREGNEKEISFLRNQRAELEAEVIKLEKSLHLDTDDLDASFSLERNNQNRLKEVDEELSQVQKDITFNNKSLAELKSKKQILRSQVSQLRNPRLLAQLSAFEDSKRQCREDLLRLESDGKNMTEQMSELISPEQEKIREIMKQHDKEELDFKEELQKLTKKVDQKNKELAKKEKGSKEFYSKYHGLFNQREKLNGEVSKLDHETEMLREKIRTHERDLNLTSLKNAEIKAKLAGLEEEFAKFKDIQLLKGKSVEQLENEIKRSEEILSTMSAVNLKALEIYDQIETEFKKLIEKKTGLDKERTDVLTLMNEIETKKTDHFMKTFEKANENFQRIFHSLFKKGKAALVLDNPQKIFEDGLSIKVKITGNRFMDIKSLSGGEKTLTALSFIFAIQEYQPASFYILDEIDAALDKHNSERLSKLVRTYANNAQYVLISHNDAVISEADTLFGVSMQDGVSKVTSLKI